jgi:hypothetical protein
MKLRSNAWNKSQQWLVTAQYAADTLPPRPADRASLKFRRTFLLRRRSAKLL